MKSLFHIFYKIRGVFLESRARREISKLKDGEYRLLASPQGGPLNIPYVSQYASVELAERYVENEDLLSTDPKWRDFGADSQEDYSFWARRICGMACFSMILSSLRRPTSKLIVLAQEAAKAGCYLPDPKNSKRIIGLLHKPFLKFAKTFGLTGKLVWYIGVNSVAQKILRNNFVIASVSNKIRWRGVQPKDKTGHLVLVHGFQVSGGEVQGFYIHNPSGFYNKSQENHFVPVEDFLSCFSGRIIVLRKK